MNPLKRHLLLTRLIISGGKFRHSGYSFAPERQEALKRLARFCPPHTDSVTEKSWKRSVLAVPYLGACLAQLVFLKNALKMKGGHLTAPDIHLCYIRVPRSANTALAYAMLLKSFPELASAAPTSQEINFLTDAHLHMTLTPAEKGNTFFTVVRNPFARIVSVYREFFEHRHDHFIYNDYLFGILRHEMSFADFVKTVRLIPDYLKDQHLKPQNSLLKFYRKRQIDVKILRLEEPDKIQRFLEQYGMRFDDMNRSEVPYDYHAYYDRDSLEVVKDMYRDDISLFGYAAEYDNAKRRVS